MLVYHVLVYHALVYHVFGERTFAIQQKLSAKMLKSRSAAFRLGRHLRALTGLVLVSSTAAILAGCASPLSEMPSQVGGLPEGVPERPANSLPYPAVHDMPPPRSTAVLTEEEKKKVEAELAAMREQQARRAGTKNPDQQ